MIFWPRLISFVARTLLFYLIKGFLFPRSDTAVLLFPTLATTRPLFFVRAQSVRSNNLPIHHRRPRTSRKKGKQPRQLQADRSSHSLIPRLSRRQKSPQLSLSCQRILSISPLAGLEEVLVSGTPTRMTRFAFRFPRLYYYIICPSLPRPQFTTHPYQCTTDPPLRDMQSAANYHKQQ